MRHASCFILPLAGILLVWFASTIVAQTSFPLSHLQPGVPRDPSWVVDWQQTNGPYGGQINALAINSSGDLFAGANGGGIFRSSTNGTSWTQINTGLTNTHVFSLIVNSSGYVFAGTESGLFRSTNNGVSWSQIATGLLPSTLNVLSLAIKSSGEFFAGTDSAGIFISTDNGSSWTQVVSGTSIPLVQSLAAHSNGAIFAGTRNGIFRSTNNGSTWTPTSTGLSDADIRVLSIHSNGFLFAGSDSGGIFRSTNNGVPWTQSNSGLLNTQIRSLAINSLGNIITGTLGGGIFKSTDNGNTWTSINTGLTITDIYSLGVKTNNFLIAGGNGGVFRSTNNGGEWIQSSTGITDANVPALVFNSSGDLFAGTLGTGVFRTTDGGEFWQYVKNGLTNLYVVELARDSVNTLYAGTYNGVYRSTDYGVNWMGMNTGLTSTFISALVARRQGEVFAGTVDGVFRSTDGGGNWVHTSSGLTSPYVQSLAINARGHIFAGTYAGGIYRSTNNSQSWTKMGLDNIDVVSISIDPNGIMYVAGWQNGVFRSTDLGVSWSEVGLRNSGVNTVATNANGFIFAGTEYEGVYRSLDHGSSWSQFNSGLSNTFISSLAISSDGYLYSGTDGSGVFRSRETTVQPRWYLISNSSQVPNDSAHVLYPIAVSSAFQYVSGIGYQPRSRLLNGIGYWLKFSPQGNVSNTGIPILSDTLEVAEGWNMIGSISSSVAIENVTTVPAGILRSSFFGYDNGYSIATYIDPMRGYWIKVSQSGQIILMANAFSSVSSSMHHSLNTFSSITINDAAGNMQQLYLSTQNDDSGQRYELPPIPPDEIFDARFGSGRMVEVINGEKKEMRVVVSSAVYPVTIQWMIQQDLQENMFFVLGEKEIPVSSNGKLQIPNADTQILLRFRSSSGKELPAVYSLKQNYPNPFNSSTKIEFELPQPVRVSLKVFNILGQEVAKLVEGDKPAGRHEIVWNYNQSRSGNLVELSSGIYFYQMTAGNFIETKAMVIIR